MFQDIQPKFLDNHYSRRRQPTQDDVVVLYRNHQVVTCSGQLPTYQKIATDWEFPLAAYTYLLTIDQTALYLLTAPATLPVGYSFTPVKRLEHLVPQWLGFGAATAAQLGEWYATNRFCGHCGHGMVADKQERALRCPNCHRIVFPTIAPAIIVGVTQGDRILMTKFLRGYQKYALISGYAEIGETLEDTVRREVQEEVGLTVHHLQYFGSQPWAFSGSLLVGYFEELDQDLPIHLEKDELSQAKWFSREKIPHDDSTSSLTWSMIEAFRNHRV